jgi:Tfp pilus assembly PilM family ATPase
MSIFDNILSPRLPSTALSLDGHSATVAQVERSRGAFGLRRAATAAMPEGLVRPDFTETNVADLERLADFLAHLAESAGLGRQSKWSAALPEACAATHILTMEQKGASRQETEELLRWKTERAFGAPYESLRVSREALPPDAAGRERYQAAGIRLSVLDEYEAVFDALGWNVGFITPRYVGEARWLQQKGATGDALLISAHPEGFTALVQRNGQPFILRSVPCDAADRDDELYRLLLFYRERAGAAEEDIPLPLNRLLVVGADSERQRITQVVNETLATGLRALTPPEVGLNLPDAKLDFASLAAPAGLAALAW